MNYLYPVHLTEMGGPFLYRLPSGLFRNEFRTTTIYIFLFFSTLRFKTLDLAIQLKIVQIYFIELCIYLIANVVPSVLDTSSLSN